MDALPQPNNFISLFLFPTVSFSNWKFACDHCWQFYDPPRQTIRGRKNICLKFILNAATTTSSGPPSAKFTATYFIPIIFDLILFSVLLQSHYLFSCLTRCCLSLDLIVFPWGTPWTRTLASVFTPVFTIQYVSVIITWDMKGIRYHHHTIKTHFKVTSVLSLPYQSVGN